MPGIDVLASNLADTRRISIQVKTKTSGTWHARYPRDAEECAEDPAEATFWIFVDLGAGQYPVYYVIPRWWIRNNIWQVHTAYLIRYKGEARPGEAEQSPRNPCRTDRAMA